MRPRAAAPPSPALGITQTTLKRWEAADQAPRPAMLVLFYESRWGQSMLYTEAHNEATFARQEVDGLKRENAMLLRAHCAA